MESRLVLLLSCENNKIQVIGGDNVSIFKVYPENQMRIVVLLVALAVLANDLRSQGKHDNILPERKEIEVHEHHNKTISGYIDSLKVEINHKKSKRNTWLWSSAIGAGVAGGLYLLGDRSYNQYQDATNSVDAQYYWNRTATIDKAFSLAAGVTLALLVPAIYNQISINADYSGTNTIPYQSIIRLSTVDYAVQGVDMEKTSDGGVILLTNTKSIKDDHFGIWVYKYDNQGQLMWDTHFQRSHVFGAKRITTAIDEGYLISGFEFNQESSTIDLVYFKIGLTGVIKWNSAFTDNHGESVINIYKDENNYILICSQQHESGHINTLIRLASNGNRIVTKTIKNSFVTNHTCPAPDGNYIILGNKYMDKISANNILAAKVDSTGQIIWEKNLTNPEHDTKVQAILAEANNEYLILTSASRIGEYKKNISLIKINERGEILSDNVVYDQEHSIPADMLKLSDGRYFITGRSENQLLGQIVDEKGEINNMLLLGEDGKYNGIRLLENEDRSVTVLGNHINKDSNIKQALMLKSYIIDN